MRTTTSLLAALALTACGTSTELSLETQGIDRGADDGVEAAVPQPVVSPGIAIVTTEGVPRLDDRTSPGASIDPENRREEDAREAPRDEAPEEPGEAGSAPIDAVFDPGETCERVPVERGCPSPYADEELTEIQQQQLGALAMACEAWMERGPASYAMDVEEFRLIPGEEAIEIAIDATVCSGATAEAYDATTGDELDAKTVASIDNLFFAAADRVMDGEQIEVRVDPNLSYITLMRVTTGGEPEPGVFEISTTIRPIAPPVID